MKISLLLTIVLPICCCAFVVDKEVAVETSHDSHDSVADSAISKRSGGSFDFVGQIKKGIFSSAGRASAALASGSSGSSSSFKKPDETHGNSLDYDPWSFKKSVLNTIFQAVKAITGGVTALKGQIIKGSGYALSASGSLIASSGDKITDVGKGIIDSAKFAPVGHSGSSSPIGKFASLSSASSGSSGGSHGSPGHGEIIPAYEIPSGHQSYGPPPKSPSGPHYLPPPGTYTSGLHFTGPASYESPPHGGYLPAETAFYRVGPTHTTYHNDFSDANHHNYHIHHDNHKYKTKYYDAIVYEHNPYMYRKYPERLKYFNPHSGPPPPFIHDRNGNTATMALKEIMQFLPKHETNKLTATYLAAPNRHKLVDQYDIPSDPVPTYTSFKVGPISSISHTRTVTTAFGKPLHVFQKHNLDPRFNAPNRHFPPQIIPEPHQSYDAYHNLALRQRQRPMNPNAIPNSLKTPYSTPEAVPQNQMPWRVPLNFPTLPSSSSSSSSSLPTPTPTLDIEALVAALEAKKKAANNQQQLNFSPVQNKGRTDRKIPLEYEDKDQKTSNVEIHKSVGFRIDDPDMFNREMFL